MTIIIAAFRQIESRYIEKLSHTYDLNKGNVSIEILESMFPNIIVLCVPMDLVEDGIDFRVKFSYKIRDTYNKFKEKWYDENI